MAELEPRPAEEQAEAEQYASALAAISNAMVRLYKETFGRGPTKSRAQFLGPDTLVVVLEDSMTVVERNQVAMNQHERLRDTPQFRAAVIDALKPLETSNSPFAFKPESSRRLHYLEPKLVAEIKFTEWTHEGESGAIKMRAPVFLGLREDKKPRECRFEMPVSAKKTAADVERKSHQKHVA